jgi:hypothetical protein
MCTSFSLLGNGSVKKLSRHEYTRNNRKILGHVVFNAVPVDERKMDGKFFPELFVVENKSKIQ